MTTKTPGQYSPEEMDRYFSDPKFRQERLRTVAPNLSGRRLRIALFTGVPLLILFIVYGVYLFSGLPSLEKIENPKPELATRVFSSDGEVLDQFFVKNRSQVTLKEIPRTTVEALLATEDKDFYSHWGVDAVRFVKAMVKNTLSLFQRREGASTITQQLSRSLYLGHEDSNVFETITRKFREFVTAIEIERTFTKDEILEAYLNVVYFGRGAYGIASAAQQYFGKPVNELSLTESATLIALVKGPAYYDPTNHPERALARRNLVLSQMQKYGYLTPSVAQMARLEPITAASFRRVLAIRHRFPLCGVYPAGTRREGREVRIRYLSGRHLRVHHP